MAYLHVTDRNGTSHTIEGAEGWRIMEILRDSGLGVEGVCGGGCDCASCHVIVAPAWAEKLHPAREEELLKLEELPAIEATSRLSCQILWSGALDGLALTIAENP